MEHKLIPKVDSLICRCEGNELGKKQAEANGRRWLIAKLICSIHSVNERGRMMRWGLGLSPSYYIIFAM